MEEVVSSNLTVDVAASCLFLLAVFLWLTWKAVDRRFIMYSRPIQRSYAILFLGAEVVQTRPRFAGVKRLTARTARAA